MGQHFNKTIKAVMVSYLFNKAVIDDSECKNIRYKASITQDIDPVTLISLDSKHKSQLLSFNVCKN